VQSCEVKSLRGVFFLAPRKSFDILALYKSDYYYVSSIYCIFVCV